MTPRTTLSRRALLGAAAGAGAAAALSGCGSGSTGSPSTTLQVWGGVPAANGPQELVDGFTAATGEQVTYTRFVNDDRGNLKVDTALQGGVDIDVYFTYAAQNMALRAGSGMALDLTDRVRADPELAPYLDTTAPRATMVDGRIVALATAREPHFLLFNESLREQAGIELPRAWTVDEFAATVRELAGPDRYGTYSVPDTARVSLGANYWYAPEGGSNFDDPAFLEWMQLGRSLIDDGAAYPWTEVLARQLEAYQQTPFLQGEFVVWPTAPFNLRYLNNAEDYPHDFLVAAAPTPTTARGDWNGGSFNNFIMINPRSTKIDLAWEFVRYWVTDGAGPMLGGGKIPALDVLPDEDVLAGVLGEEPEQWFDVESFRRTLFTDEPKLMTDTILSAVPEISLVSEQQRNLCWIGEKSPADAVASIDALADAAIRRYERQA
ncbi:ABC transporter substrate-binding protein [Desertihabitans brevis]|uniref:ABC transporter substrate-binding protein n=1 Tax=Desertihabitans brevis TaxID=2268447 RepID=A0A367YWP8_9ACTN|nr:extracellular solute-binding protein [Desertihabitans brevis]RCK70157.1 ABC transporter substrate-binding protein [Desertihabitans brevis]